MKSQKLFGFIGMYVSLDFEGCSCYHFNILFYKKVTTCHHPVAFEKALGLLVTPALTVSTRPAASSEKGGAIRPDWS